MMKIKNFKNLRYLSFLVVGIIFLPAPYLFNPYVIHLLIAIFFYATLSTSWDLISGYTGQFSFAHATFAAISSYSFGLIARYLGYSAPISFLLGIGFSTLIGTLIGILCLRMKGVYLTLTTLAFAGILNMWLLNEFAITGGTEGLGIPLIFGTYIKHPYYFLALAIFLVSVLIKFLIVNSRLGLRFLAIREDEYAAEIHGINTTKEKVLAFTISSCLAAIAGGLLSGYIGRITPKTMDLRMMFRVIVMTYVGGTSSILGPIVGAFVVRLIEEFTRSFEMIHMIIWGFILIVIFFLLPDGIWGTLRSKLQKIPKFQEFFAKWES